MLFQNLTVNGCRNGRSLVICLLIGQLFRQSSSSRLKSELVVIVTPTVDARWRGYLGYGYQPATAPSRSLVQSGR